MSRPSDSEVAALCSAAREAAELAYAPYSRFPVGAAVLGAADTYRGANIENASFGLGLCAERAALSAAILAGEQVIRAVAVACGPGDSVLRYTLDELMPRPFRLAARAGRPA